jgi:hypothetical protein
MNDSGKGVLWFLGGCMAFTEAALGAISSLSSDVEGKDIVLLCTVSLFLVLTALVLMFFRNPQLLIAQSKDLVPLALLDRIQGWEDPRLVQMVLNRLVSGGGETVDDEEAEEAPLEEDRKAFTDAMKQVGV